MGTHMRALGDSYPMNTNMIRLRWFSKTLHSFPLDESSLSIARVNNKVYLEKYFIGSC